MATTTEHGRTSDAWPVGANAVEWAEAINAPAFYMTSQGYIAPLTSADVAAIKSGE